MFVKMLAAARTRNVYRSIMLPPVNAYLVMVVKLLIQLSDADHCQFHALHQLIVQLMRIVMVVFVNRLVLWIKNADWMRFAWKVNALIHVHCQKLVE